MYTYQIFTAEDSSNKRVNAARKSFHCEGESCYVLIRNGQMFMVQFESNLPYPGATIEESAENHIAQLIAEQESQTTEA
jgi:hypothetical protein